VLSPVELRAGFVLLSRAGSAVLCQPVKPFPSATLSRLAIQVSQVTWPRQDLSLHLLFRPHLLPRPSSSLRRLLSLKSRQKLQHQLPLPGSRHNSCRRS
jgi:hypothetical protein